MKDFDVVVVGAGPAGGQCARLLAKAGHKVLLVEQHENFYKNNFSSAATPLKTLEQFDLPEEVSGSFWNKIIIVTTNITRSWDSSKSLGVVLDFAKFREFLAKDVEKNDGKVWMGCRYIQYAKEDNKTLVFLKRRNEDIIKVSTKILVDATGFSREVIYPRKKEQPTLFKATGIEYLIEVDEKTYQNYFNSLIFFLGHKWCPKGYSWLFPMSQNQLKVGAACYNAEHKIIEQVKPLKEYISLICKDYLRLEDCKIIDIHGSIIKYSLGLQDIYYRDDQIIAIGDAVSTVNLLGGEGIRHAMQGAEIACKYIQAKLNNKKVNFQDYQSEMYDNFSQKWNLSEKISRKVYLEYNDQKIDRGVALLKLLKTEDIIDILFYYQLEKFTKGLKGDLIKKVNLLIQSIKKILSL